MITLTSITRTQVETAIADSDIDHAAYGGYTGNTFEQELYPLMAAMTNAGLYPDGVNLTLALVWNDDTTTNGGHVIIRLPNGLKLATPFIDLRHLVNDRDTVGMAALVDVAKNILSRSQEVLSTYRAVCR